MDPAKLKVVELRQELASRGLDQKGVKAILVSRLQAALDAERSETPQSISSESGESEQNNVETSQPIDSSDGSPSKGKDQEKDEKLKDDEEVENTAANAEKASIEPTEVVDRTVPPVSDPVPIEENKPSQAVELKPKENQQSVTSMDVDEEVNTQQQKETSIAEDIDLKDNDMQQHIQEPKQEDTDIAMKDESVDSSKIKEETDLDSEQGLEKQKNEVDAKTESGDDDKTSLTQSEDKRDGESDSDRKDRKRKRSKSRSKSSSPTVRRPRRTSPVQNTDDFTNVEDEPEIDPNTVVLSWVDSDLNLKVNSDFLSASPISDGPLHMAWAGVRATHGVKNGKVSYEVYIDDLHRVRGLCDRNVHEIRCGWSVKTSDLQLGESPLSFGYGGSGKKAVNNEFTDYGCKFKTRGDVIGCYLDLESEPCKIEYTVNGEPQGVAFEFDKSELGDEALYPHILSKNVSFKVNFGEMETPFVSKIKPKTKHDDRSRRDRRSDRESKRDRSRSRTRSRSRERDERKDRSEDPEKKEDENPNNDDAALTTSQDKADEPAAEKKIEDKSEDVEQKEENVADVADSNGENQSKDAEDADSTAEKEMLPGYEFIGKLPLDQLVAGFSRPDSRKDCEVIMLIGLPGSGKSYWAKNFVNENIEKRFQILGVQPLLSKMTINGEPRKKHVEIKWDRFIDSCIRGVNIIQDIATKRRRNYIIDQTNCISSVQRRKIKGFGDFKRLAVVFVPDDDVYKERLEKKIENEGKEVSEYSSDDMKANFAIPNSGCWFDDIQFVGLEAEEAKAKIAEYNEQGKKALQSHPSSYNRGSRDYRQRRDDFRDRDRRWDRRSDGRSDWRSQNWRGGGSGFDRRDRWHGGGGGGGGGGNWVNNYRGNNRYDDRGYRGFNSGGYSRHRDFGHERDRRDDRGRNENRSDHRDFRDGNRDRRGEDKRRQDRGVPQRQKDEKNFTKQQPIQNYKSTKTEPPTQGHWNPSVVGPHANNWNNYYQQQQNWGEYNQQQNWVQWNQQQQGQASSNYSTQQPHQDWSNWQQQTQQPPPPPHQQQQQDVTQGGWQNWAQHAQHYGNAGDQPNPLSK